MKLSLLHYRILLFGLFCLSCTGCKKSSTSSTPATSSINSINHVVVIYLENHSFDNLYGQFSGAHGISDATPATTIQDSLTGVPYIYLPVIPGTDKFPANLPNAPFNIDQYIPSDMPTPDLAHSYYQEQMQINGGKMDMFARYNYSKGMSQGYYTTSKLPLAVLAQKYTLCDNFFHSAFGGSFLNHIWLIAAASPIFPDAPTNIVSSVDPITGSVIADGQVSPDGYVINTSYTINNPHPSWSTVQDLLPNQTLPTIGDRLNDKNITWGWYSGGWNDAIAGNPAATFQFHHQPFAYFANYADGTPLKAAHLKDETDFFTAATIGTLPSVTFVKPLGIDSEHPGYTNVYDGEMHAIELINAVLNGPNGKDAVIIVTYDENGGFWDHVPPPVIDTKWGPGTRVPTIIISPFAKIGFVDHTQYETVSILSFIEKRWGLAPLSNRDKIAIPLTNAFNY